MSHSACGRCVGKYLSSFCQWISIFQQAHCLFICKNLLISFSFPIQSSFLSQPCHINTFSNSSKCWLGFLENSKVRTSEFFGGFLPRYFPQFIVNCLPCQQSLQYAMSPAQDPALPRGCPGYKTELFQFWRSGECAVPIQYYYSQIHSDSEWLYLIVSSMCPIESFKNYSYSKPYAKKHNKKQPLESTTQKYKCTMNAIP